MLELIDGLIELLEPALTRTVSVDDSGAEPISYEKDTLYLFEAGDQVADMAGNSPSDLERFTLVAVLTVDDKGERAEGFRKREVSEALDVKRREYLKKVRSNRTGPLIPGPDNVPLWSNITGASNPEFIRALDVRGLAITLRGWRLVEEIEP